jgi:hypothetical protein
MTALDKRLGSRQLVLGQTQLAFALENLCAGFIQDLACQRDRRLGAVELGLELPCVDSRQERRRHEVSLADCDLASLAAVHGGDLDFARLDPAVPRHDPHRQGG